MYMYFSMSEGEELFTVFDYKRLLESVQTHFRLQIIEQDLTPLYVYAFYSPGQCRGCITFDILDKNAYIEIRDMQFSNGNDVLNVYFDTH